MSIQFPRKPWQDGQTFKHTASDGTEVFGVYDEARNAWSFYRRNEDGSSSAPGLVTTADVKTLNERPDTIRNPFSLTSDPNTVVNQQEANWWLYENMGARTPIFDNNPPTFHPGYSGSNADLQPGDVWIDTSVSGQFSVSIWDGTLWVPIAIGSRPPIFSDTEPTEHPGFSGDQAELVPGDIWFDTTDQFNVIQYVWNGTAWVETGSNVYTSDVKTVAVQNPRIQQSPKELPDLKTQYDVNWYMMSAIEKSVAVIAFLQSQINGFPDMIVGPDAPNNDNGALNFWYNTLNDTLYFWDPITEQWHAVQYPRVPIFSDTAPTEHPHVPDPKDLIIGDIWIDTSANPILVDYIWDGSQWVNIEDRYVHSKGGDSMEGPLRITGNRGPDAQGRESTIKVLNVDSAENSSLQLKQNGTTRAYVGSGELTLTTDLKFNNPNKHIYAGNDKNGFEVNNNGIFYLGDMVKEEHVINKGYSDGGDQVLDAKITELRLELDALAPVADNGVWRWEDGVSVPSVGNFALLNGSNPTDQYSQATAVKMHQQDWEGTDHSFSTVAVGELIQLFDRFEPDYLLGEITAVDTTEMQPDSSGYISVQFTRTASNGAPDFGGEGEPLVNIKIYSKPTDIDGDTAFLPIQGGTMEGNINMQDNKINFYADNHNRDHLHFSRIPGTYVDAIRFDHPGGQVNGGYDIRLLGNTSYNWLRLCGLSNGDEPLVTARASGEIKFVHDNIRFNNNKLRDVAPGVSDTDAVNLGQIKEGLAELRDEFLKDLIVGRWNSDNFQTLVTAAPDRMITVTSDGKAATRLSDVALIRFHQRDNSGSEVQWDHWDPGEIVTLRQTDDPSVTATYRLLTSVNVNNETRSFSVEFINAQNDSDQVFGYYEEYAVTLTEFSEGFNGADLDNVYYRVDGSNGPLTEPVTVSTNDQFGDAELILEGKRDNSSNACGVLRFTNTQNTDGSGEISYYTFGSTRKFTFNENVDLTNNNLTNVGNIQYTTSGGYLSVGGSPRITLQTGASSTNGAANVHISRANTSVRRTFAIEGKNSGGGIEDMFYAYTRDNGDYIVYKGDTSISTSIQTKNSVQALIDASIDGIGGGGGAVQRPGRRFKYASTVGSSGTFSEDGSRWQFSYYDLDDIRIAHRNSPDFSWSSGPKMTIWDETGDLVVAVELCAKTDYSSNQLKFRRDEADYKEHLHRGLTPGSTYYVKIEGYF
jgi:hypothetical protein